MSPLTTIAHSYHPTEAALWVAALEGAGFSVFLPGFHTCSLLPHNIVALGGLPLMVPRDQAAEARAFLAAHEQSASSQSEATERKHLFGLNKAGARLVIGIICYYLGGAPVFPGLFLASDESRRL